MNNEALKFFDALPMCLCFVDYFQTFSIVVGATRYWSKSVELEGGWVILAVMKLETA